LRQAAGVILVADSSSALASKFTNIQAHLSATAKIIVISCDPSVSTEGVGTEKPFTVDLPSITESGTQVVAEDLNRLLATCTLALFGKDEPDEIIQYAYFGGEVVNSKQQVMSNMSAADIEAERRRFASSTVAAAVAAATAEHIVAQANPTLGAKAAAMAAEVADAVAKGDSERASKAVIAAANSVDEVVALAKFNAAAKENGHNRCSDDTSIYPEDESTSRRLQQKSAMCAIL